MAKGKGKRRPPAAVESPTGSCLMLCDDVLISTARRRQVIQGVIDGIRVRELPTTIGPFVAYVRLSNVYGGQKIVFDLVNAGTDEELFKFTAISPESADPLKTHTLVQRVSPFEVRATGRYHFRASPPGGMPFVESLIQIDRADVPNTDGE